MSRSRRWIRRPALRSPTRSTEILRREGKTAILVTHDIGEAISMAERVVVLSRRPGRVKSRARRSGSPAPRRPSRAVRRAQHARVQWLLQHALEGARSPCRRLKRESGPARSREVASPQYLRMAAPRTARPPDGAGLATRVLLAVFLVLWEVAAAGSTGSTRCSPATRRPSGRHSWSMLKTTPQQAEHPGAHLGDGVRHGGRLYGGDGARHRDRRGAVVVGQSSTTCSTRIWSCSMPCRRPLSCRCSTSGWAPRCRSTACRWRSRCSSPC